jgi:hypothetical protein
LLIYFLYEDIGPNSNSSTSESQMIAVAFFTISVLGVLAVMVQLFSDAFTPRGLPEGRF